MKIFVAYLSMVGFGLSFLCFVGFGPPELLTAEKIEVTMAFARANPDGPYTQSQLDVFVASQEGVEKSESFGHYLRYDSRIEKKNILVPVGFDDCYLFDIDEKCWIFYGYKVSLLRRCKKYYY